MLEEMERAREGLQALGELREGPLAVGTSDTLACYVLPPVIAAFRARYPGVDLRLDNRPSPATAERVAERAVDLGVVTLPLPPELRDRRAARGGAAPGRAAARARRRWPSVRPATRWPAAAARAAGGARSRTRCCSSTGAPARVRCSTRSWPGSARRPDVAMEMSSVEVLKKLVELGLGVSVVPALAVEREVATGALAAVRLVGMAAERWVGLLTPAAGPPSVAAGAFAGIARAILPTRGERERQTKRRPIR